MNPIRHLVARMANAALDDVTLTSGTAMLVVVAHDESHDHVWSVTGTTPDVDAYSADDDRDRALDHVRRTVESGQWDGVIGVPSRPQDDRG